MHTAIDPLCLTTEHAKLAITQFFRFRFPHTYIVIQLAKNLSLDSLADNNLKSLSPVPEEKEAEFDDESSGENCSHTQCG